MTRPSLQSSAQALSFNLTQLAETFNANRQFFKEAHAYPLNTFPGNTHEGLLQQLLRKKLEPASEAWIDEHTKDKRYENRETNGVSAAQGDTLSEESLKDLWSWAASASAGIVRPMLEDDIFEDDFTIAERENGIEHVVTGLKRKLGEEDDEDENDENEDESMADASMLSQDVQDFAKVGIDADASALPIETVLKFMVTGIGPNSAVLDR